MKNNDINRRFKDDEKIVNVSLLMSPIGILVTFNSYIKKDLENDENKIKLYKMHYKNLFKLIFFLVIGKLKNSNNKILDLEKDGSIIGTYSAISNMLN
ncbi:MAG: hypothetical protein ACK5HL_04505 [Bacilli bacterium]